MTAYYSIETPTDRALFTMRLFDHQGGFCAVCGKPMLPIIEDGKMVTAPGTGRNRKRASLEHVWPLDSSKVRHGMIRPSLHRFRRGTAGNSVASHRGCNNAKGNREPTGCELIWLAAVNARIEAEAPGFRKVPCRHCGRRFASGHDLDQHRQAKHFRALAVG